MNLQGDIENMTAIKQSIKSHIFWETWNSEVQKTFRFSICPHFSVIFPVNVTRLQQSIRGYFSNAGKVGSPLRNTV